MNGPCERAEPLGPLASDVFVHFVHSVHHNGGVLHTNTPPWRQSLEMKDRERMTQQAFGRRIAARFDKKSRVVLDGKQGPAYFGIGLRDDRQEGPM